MATAGGIRDGASPNFPHMMQHVDGLYQTGIQHRNLTNIGGDGGLTLWRRALADDPSDPLSYDTYDLLADTTFRAELNLPINPVDDHWCVAFAIDGDDVMHFSGNQHAHIDWDGYASTLDGQRVIMGTWSPPAAPTWTTPPTYSSRPWAAYGANSHTYNIYNRLSDGTLLWFFDQQDNVTNSRGRDWLCFYRVPGGTAGFNGWLPLLGSTGEFASTFEVNPQGTDADRVYISSVVVEPHYFGYQVDRIWVLGHWRLYNDHGDSVIDPFLIKFSSADIGGTTGFTSVDDLPITMPITWLGRANATVDACTAWGAAGGLAIDHEGNPHMAMDNGTTDQGAYGGGTLTSIVDEFGNTVSLLSGSPATPDLYFRVYWHNGAWHRAKMIGIGSSQTPQFWKMGKDLWMGTAAGDRIRIRPLKGAPGSPSIFMGTAINSSDTTGAGDPTNETYEPLCDPVALAEEGRLDLFVPDGGTHAGDKRVFSAGGYNPSARYRGATEQILITGNSNHGILLTSLYIYVDGPTGNFGFSGFRAPGGGTPVHGMRLWVVNHHNFNMTAVEEGTGTTTPAWRIYTGSGNKSTTGKGAMLFVYDGVTLNRWVWQATYD